MLRGWTRDHKFAALAIVVTAVGVLVAILAYTRDYYGWTNGSDNSANSPTAPSVTTAPGVSGLSDEGLVPTVAASDGASVPAERTRSGPDPIDLPAEVGRYEMERVIKDGVNSLTLTRVEVLDSAKLKIVIRYQSHSTGIWKLKCPPPESDLQSSHIELADSRRIYPEDTFCTSERPGQSIEVRPGDHYDSWAVYPTVPFRGKGFDLHWYSYPTVEGILLR